MNVLVTFKRTYFANLLVRNAESAEQVKKLLKSQDWDIQEFFEDGEDEAFLNSGELEGSDVWDVWDTDCPVSKYDYDAEIDLDELENVSEANNG